MSDHVAVCIAHLTKPKPLQSLQETGILESSREGCCINITDSTSAITDNRILGENYMYKDEEPLIQSIECRICQEEDIVKNLESPCACSGSLKFAHRTCVQRWCNEKGDITCEICNQPYQPGYTAPTRPPIDISGSHIVSVNPLDTHGRHFLEPEYNDTSANGNAFCRSAALILLALLLLRHVMLINNGDADDDPSTFFSLFLLRAAGFLLPCYIMAWALNAMQRRRERQEAAEVLAATEDAFLGQAGRDAGLRIAIPPGSAVASHHEPLLQ